MPRLSELPINADLTSNEIMVVVQDGETRQITLSAALMAHHPASINHARWIQSSYSNGLLNSSAILLELTVASSGGC